MENRKERAASGLCSTRNGSERQATNEQNLSQIDSPDHPMEEGSLILNKALIYAGCGWAVFPVHTIVDGQCSCGKENCPSPGKHPRTLHGYKDASTDETQIRAWWTEHPNSNVAIVTGCKSGLVVLDVDPRHGGPETLESLEDKYGRLPHTVEALTGGGGRHLFFQHPGEGTVIHNDTGKKLGRGLDIRGDGGYVVAPPSLHASGKHYVWEVSSTPDEIEVAELPAWLAQRLQDPVNTDTPCDPSTSKILKGQRNTTLFILGCCMRKKGVAPSDIEATLQGVNRLNCEPPLGDQEVRRIAQSASQYLPNPSPDSWVQDMNDLHAVVLYGGKTLILNEEYDPVRDVKDISFSTPADLRLRYQNKLIPTEDGQSNIATVWLKHSQRREYQGIVFGPNQSFHGHYNLWRGFAVDPLKGDCERYLDHLFTNIAQGDQAIYNYILGWMAHTVQFPDQRPGVALVLRGKQGTGKGVMCTQYGKLFGQHFIQIQQQSHLLGNFNAHLKDKLVVFADEAFWAGNRPGEGPLKAMVTEEQILIEFKGKDAIPFQNYIRLLVASNHDWVVPAGLEERRFCVLDVGEDHMQDHAYFEKLINQMDHGGREALLYFLQNYNLSGLNLRQFPQTKALQENKLQSMSSAEKFLVERLEVGTILPDETCWTGWVVKRRLHEEYIRQAKDIGQSRRSNETELGKTLNALVPGLRQTTKKIDGKREAIWEFPDLKTCREHFNRITRFEHEWPEEHESKGDLTA